MHAVDEDGRLCGVGEAGHAGAGRPGRRLSEIYDDDPVRVGPDTDVVDVAVLMSDYNLITIPVVDERRKMIGVITVDDVLEVTLPDDWRRREAAQPPDAHRGHVSDGAARPGSRRPPTARSPPRRRARVDERRSRREPAAAGQPAAPGRRRAGRLAAPRAAAGPQLRAVPRRPSAVLDEAHLGDIEGALGRIRLATSSAARLAAAAGHVPRHRRARA